MAVDSKARSRAGAAAALEAIRRLNHLLFAEAWSEWAHLDISMAQLKAVMVLHEVEGLTVSGLAARLGTKPSAASILVERLVQQGLARRIEDPNDRRRVLLRLTPEAGVLVDRLRRGRDRLEEWIGALTREELTALTAGIDALVRVGESASPVEGHAPDCPGPHARTRPRS